MKICADAMTEHKRGTGNNQCWRCGQEGHKSEQCKVTIYCLCGEGTQHMPFSCPGLSRQGRIATLKDMVVNHYSEPYCVLCRAGRGGIGGKKKGHHMSRCPLLKHGTTEAVMPRLIVDVCQGVMSKLLIDKGEVEGGGPVRLVSPDARNLLDENFEEFHRGTRGSKAMGIGEGVWGPMWKSMETDMFPNLPGSASNLAGTAVNTTAAQGGATASSSSAGARTEPPGAFVRGPWREFLWWR